MEPEVFLEQSDVVPLTKALKQVLMQIDTASARRTLLEIAGIDSAFMGTLRPESEPNLFAPKLVVEFRKYRISTRRLNYHPMVSLLGYLCDFAEDYSLPDQDVALFSRFLEQGQENFKALKVRNAVGRIESPKGTGIGTAVLVGKNLLLTCNHVFSKTQVQQAWVRFGYKTGSYGLEDVFELDLEFVSHHNRPDYALVRIQGEPQQPIIPLSNDLLDAGQEIRLIHHPLGKPVVISGIGQMVQVGEDYIDHNISADEGSSGAPIFNRHWQLVAIHQGHPGIGRSVITGTLGGVPIRIIWNQIIPHLPGTEQGANK